MFIPQVYVFKVTMQYYFERFDVGFKFKRTIRATVYCFKN